MVKEALVEIALSQFEDDEMEVIQNKVKSMDIHEVQDEFEGYNEYEYDSSEPDEYEVRYDDRERMYAAQPAEVIYDDHTSENEDTDDISYHYYSD